MLTNKKPASIKAGIFIYGAGCAGGAGGFGASRIAPQLVPNMASNAPSITNRNNLFFMSGDVY